MISIELNGLLQWKFLVSMGAYLLPWFLGSGWLIGLRRLLRRANSTSAPCAWVQGANWEGPTAGSKYQAGNGQYLVGKMVDYPMEAHRMETHTTSMEKKSIVSTSFAPMELDESFH